MSFDGVCGSGTSVLVTGAGGFIGSRLVRRLLERGGEVTALDCDVDRLSALTTDPLTGALRTISCDITSAPDVDAAMRKVQPQALVHLAAEHVIPWCEKRPASAVTTNVAGLLNVLSAASWASIERVVFASTADVYAPSSQPLCETDPLGPSSVYGSTKLLGERLVSEWAELGSGRKATSLRIFNVYGPGDRNPHVIPEIVGGIAADAAVQLGNRESRRDFIHVDDVVEIICRILELPVPPNRLNAGTGVATSVADLVSALEALVARPFDTAEDRAKIRAVDRPHLQADTSRASELLPQFLPRPLGVGLRQMLASLGVPQRQLP